MRLGVACAAACALAPTVAAFGSDAIAPSEVMEWEDFKELFGRDYSGSEESRRAAIYQENVALIQRVNAQHDAGNSSVRLGVNDFADLTNDEFKEMNTFRLSNLSDTAATILPPADAGATIDWRTKGAVTPVKNQYRCGGCWAFASVAVVESSYQIATKSLRVLSEQQLLDCSNQGGCEGGEVPGGMAYVEGNKGVDLAKEYTWLEGTAPNPPPKLPCWKAAEANHAATIAKHTVVKVGDESQMAAALLKNPLATAVFADSNVFQLYKSGVIKAGQGCRPHNTAPNHAVTIVGMTADAWIVKNSWGPGWGAAGYVQVARGTTGPGVCGIALQNIYPTTAAPSPAPLPPPAKGPRPPPPPPPAPPSPIPGNAPYTTITSGTCKSHGYEVVAQDECAKQAAPAIHRPWGGSFGCNQGCPGGCVLDTISCASCVAFYVPGDPHAGCAGDIQCVCKKK